MTLLDGITQRILEEAQQISGAGEAGPGSKPEAKPLTSLDIHKVRAGRRLQQMATNGTVQGQRAASAPRPQAQFWLRGMRAAGLEGRARPAHPAPPALCCPGAQAGPARRPAALPAHGDQAGVAPGQAEPQGASEEAESARQRQQRRGGSRRAACARGRGQGECTYGGGCQRAGTAVDGAGSSELRRANCC